MPFIWRVEFILKCESRRKAMKKSEMYKKTIVDVVNVISMSGEELSDARFEQLFTLFLEYSSAIGVEELNESQYPEDCIRVAEIS